MNETIDLLREMNAGLQARLDVMEVAIAEMRQELLEVTQPASKQQNIVPIEKAWKLLGLPSYAACFDRIANGFYRIGKEAIDRRSPQSMRARWYLNIDACKKRDLEPARKRV